MQPKMVEPPSMRSIWKVIFAVTALIEVHYIALLMRRVQDDGVIESEAGYTCGPSLVKYEENEFSIHYTLMDRTWESTLTILELVFVWVGPFFCSLCLVEALIRAVEARNTALDSRALDDLEKSLLQAARKNTIKLSMFFTGAAADQGHNEKVTKKVSKALRSWVPSLGTIAFWLFIFPTDVSEFHHRCGSGISLDSAVMTQWLSRASLSLSNLASACHGLVEAVAESFFWTKILPFRIHKEPQRFIQRLQVILRWIRFARFASPLFRMGMKVQDHVRAFWKARHQSKKSDIEKQRRVDRPSIIFSDIQRLLQLAKQQTALARVPSFNLRSSMRVNNFSTSVIESYKKKREFGKKISKQLAKLQKDYLNFSIGNSYVATSDLHDRIVKMSQDITTSIHSERRRFSHRYLTSLRSLLSSRRYLISPRTRFSLAWRLAVTNCLVLEIARLFASWHLSKTFSIPLSQAVGMMLVECKAPEKTNGRLAFITGYINEFRRRMFDKFPLFGPPPVNITCITSGPQASLILYFGRMIEVFVDAIVFMDIFVWFLTGDIDVDTHAIIPKPFFTRCCIPGTLVQVLDHPTLPDLIPGLLKSALGAFASIGYSRCIRWILALMPALKMIVLDPMLDFFFKHIEEDEGLMHIAESVGMLTPERKVGTLYGSTGSLGTGAGDSKGHFLRRLSGGVYTSQVGLAYDATPTSSHDDVKDSLVSTEALSIHDTEHLPSPLCKPTFSGIPMQNSHLRSRKSVHFGPFDDTENQSADKGGDKNVGYPLSPDDLHAPEKIFVDFSDSIQYANKIVVDKNVSWSLNAGELKTSAISPDPETKSTHSTSEERINKDPSAINKVVAEGVCYTMTTCELNVSAVSYNNNINLVQPAGKVIEEKLRPIGNAISEAAAVENTPNTGDDVCDDDCDDDDDVVSATAEDRAASQQTIPIDWLDKELAAENDGNKQPESGHELMETMISSSTELNNESRAERLEYQVSPNQKYG